MGRVLDRLGAKIDLYRKWEENAYNRLNQSGGQVIWMKCALCLVDKETVPVKLNLATIHGTKNEMFNICKECLDLAHQAYLDKDFLAVKAGSNAAPHGAHAAHCDAHGAHH